MLQSQVLIYGSPLQMKQLEYSEFSPPLQAPLSVHALLSGPRVQKNPSDQDYLVVL